MAAIPSREVRFQQCQARTEQLTARFKENQARFKQDRIELCDAERQCELLAYERSCLEPAIYFLGRIPSTVIDLIVRIASTALFGIGVFTCCCNRRLKSLLKFSWREVKCLSAEIPYLFYAAFYPKTGIDAYCNLRIRQEQGK